MTVVHESIGIADAPRRRVDLMFTEHGPVIWQDHSRALTLRWVGSEPGTAGYLASLAVDRAENWSQFEEAVARWKVPSENIVYADRSGNIGEHSVGLVPIRHWTGLLPVPGSGGYEWQGFLPVAKLPHTFNPAAGYVATANHRMIPDNYPYRVGFEWDPGYRFTRIETVIEDSAKQGRQLSLSDMQNLQNDVTSLPAVELQHLLQTTTLAQDPSLRQFLTWNAQLTRDSGDAALYEVWLREITKALGRQISARFAAHYQDLPPNTVLRIIAHPDAEFFGPDPVVQRDRILLETLRGARQFLAAQLGADSHHWAWGLLHQIEFRHALDEQPAAAKGLFDIGRTARPGDGFTVNATYASSDSWQQIEGASYRQVIDLSDWDQSVAVNVPGQSGQPASSHYADLVHLWDAGEYFPLSYSNEFVAKAQVNELVLEPNE
jgi:penicillin amidase